MLFVLFLGMLWKKLIERKVLTDSLWKGLAERRHWIQYLFKPKPGAEPHPGHEFYRKLYPNIIKVSKITRHGFIPLFPIDLTCGRPFELTPS